MIEQTGKISDGLTIHHWRTRDEFDALLMDTVDGLLPEGEDEEGGPLTPAQSFNRLMGLYDNGYVNNQGYEFYKHLKLDRLQCLALYRGGSGGTVTVNAAIQGRFRTDKDSSELSSFYHSDKVIRTSNWYTGWGKDRRLALSNGSLGIVTGEGYKRKYYFPDADRPFSYIDNEENLDKIGSWSPAGAKWGSSGGRVYATAMAVLSLEVYYRYLPLYKH